MFFVKVLKWQSHPNNVSLCQDCYLNEDGSELVVPFNIVETMAVLTKCSFDENHRQPISNLGGIPAIADLIQVSLLHSFSVLI